MALGTVTLEWQQQKVIVNPTILPTKIMAIRRASLHTTVAVAGQARLERALFSG
jgi:hypothetical protein